MMRMLQHLKWPNQKDSSNTLDIANNIDHQMNSISMMTTTATRTITTWSTAVLRGFNLVTLKPAGQ
jgi:hypothetical protein